MPSTEGLFWSLAVIPSCLSLSFLYDIRHGYGLFLGEPSRMMIPAIDTGHKISNLIPRLEYESVDIDSIPADNGADLYTKIRFRYPGAMAVSKTGIGVKSEGQLLISGTCSHP